MTKIKLATISTRAPKKLDKEKTKLEIIRLKEQIAALQNLLYAEGKNSLLIILQGMDASGKDGVVKNVFSAVNPLGCRVIPFKQPSTMEMKHDFLWRIHQEVPEKGMIAVFNRSHYEDVLIQKVHHWVADDVIQKRYTHITNFEKLLIDNNTVILKFYLHVSKEEQLLRLEERLSDATKMWKYNENDIKERAFWDDYRTAYEAVFENCSSAAPWQIIPADQNWYKEYLIAKAVASALENLKMKFPGLKK
jgi:PPK2 family polyphosphate:nucleotide phosphotransferase